jgi:hypothetical protein
VLLFVSPQARATPNHSTINSSEARGGARLTKCANVKELPPGDVNLTFTFDGLKPIPFINGEPELAKRIGLQSQGSDLVISFPEFFGEQRASACLDEIRSKLGTNQIRSISGVGYSNGGAALLEFAKSVCKKGLTMEKAVLLDYVPRLFDQVFIEPFRFIGRLFGADTRVKKPDCVKELTQHKQGPGIGLSGRSVAGASHTINYMGADHFSVVSSAASRIRSELNSNLTKPAGDPAYDFLNTRYAAAPAKEPNSGPLASNFVSQKKLAAQAPPTSVGTTSASASDPPQATTLAASSSDANASAKSSAVATSSTMDSKQNNVEALGNRALVSATQDARLANPNDPNVTAIPLEGTTVDLGTLNDQTQVILIPVAVRKQAGTYYVVYRVNGKAVQGSRFMKEPGADNYLTIPFNPTLGDQTIDVQSTVPMIAAKSPNQFRDTLNFKVVDSAVAQTQPAPQPIGSEQAQRTAHR